MSRPHVVCSQCLGTGRHELTGRLWDTYWRMPVEQWLATEAVAALYRARSRTRRARTMLLYRLNALVALGLVSRRKNRAGRGLEWTRVE